MRPGARPWMLIPALLLCLAALPPAFARAGDVAVVISGASEGLQQALEGFQENLPGRPVKVYNIKDADEELEPFYKGLVATGRPDLIFALGRKAAEGARRYVDDAPVVFAMAVHHPPETDLKADNMTGVSSRLPPARVFSLLKIFLPNATKIGVVFNPRNTRALVAEAEAQARQEGVELIASRVDSELDVERSFRLFKEGIDAFWLIHDETVLSPAAVRSVIKFTLREKIPLVAFDSIYVRAGAFLSIEPNPKGMGAQAAALAKRILVGEKPENMPIEAPKGVLLGLNLRSGRLIGRLEDAAINVLVYAAENKLDITVVK